MFRRLAAPIAFAVIATSSPAKAPSAAALSLTNDPEIARAAAGIEDEHKSDLVGVNPVLIGVLAIVVTIAALYVFESIFSSP